MAEAFEITATCKNQERNFDAELRMFGYSYKIAVQVEGIEIIFEPDEEKNFRAVLPDGAVFEKKPDTALLQAIAEALGTAFK